MGRSVTGKGAGVHENDTRSRGSTKGNIGVQCEAAARDRDRRATRRGAVSRGKISDDGRIVVPISACQGVGAEVIGHRHIHQAGRVRRGGAGDRRGIDYRDARGADPVEGHRRGSDLREVAAFGQDVVYEIEEPGTQ